MPGVILTPGKTQIRDARGVPDPPPCPGFRTLTDD